MKLIILKCIDCDTEILRLQKMVIKQSDIDMYLAGCICDCGGSCACIGPEDI